MLTQGRILVVDDSKTNILILARSLRKHGYEVAVASDGFEAVRRAESEQPDLILLDVMMPDRDGFETCKVLKSSPTTASIPVIFITACSSPENMLKAFEVGGCDYVTKPFRIAEVLARASVHVRLRRAEQELLREREEASALAGRVSEANMKLARLSQVDPLTDLLNRRAWEQAARSEEARSRRAGGSFAILMIDVDRFKAFNDAQGHQVGDDCLCCVAEAIFRTSRAIDVVGRYGGEEFVVLAPNTSAKGVLALAERIRTAVWNLAVPHPQSYEGRVTVSVGASVSGGFGWQEVMRRADQAMYEAKQSGRNRVCVAEDAATVTGNPSGAEAPSDTTRLPASARQSSNEGHDGVEEREPSYQAAPDAASSPSPGSAANPLGELAHNPEAFARFESFLAHLEDTAQVVARTFAEQGIDALAQAAQELSVRADPKGASPLTHLAWKLRHSASVSKEFARLATDAQALANISRTFQATTDKKASH